MLPECHTHKAKSESDAKLMTSDLFTNTKLPHFVEDIIQRKGLCVSGQAEPNMLLLALPQCCGVKSSESVNADPKVMLSKPC